MDKFKSRINQILNIDRFDYRQEVLWNNLNKKPVILYGVGECSHWFHEIIIKIYGIKPFAVVDKKFIKSEDWNSISAYSLDNLVLNSKIKNECIVVICIGNINIEKEIYKKLKLYGFKNIIGLIEIYQIHNPFGLPHGLKQKGICFFKEHTEIITNTLALFEDNVSREIYVSFLETHITKKPVRLPMSPRNQQYFPKDLTLNKGYSRFVNCGSYDGDTIHILNSKFGKIQKLACFEPEIKIFERLSNYLYVNKMRLAEEIHILPCAVSNVNRIENFISGNGLGSRIDENGTDKVKAVSLDKVLIGFDPTFINMDIEGQELNALYGSIEILNFCKPDLAICVYHSPDHIWEIPNQLNTLNLGYKFFLRNYTSYSLETVLYCTTKC